MVRRPEAIIFQRHRRPFAAGLASRVTWGDVSRETLEVTQLGRDPMRRPDAAHRVPHDVKGASHQGRCATQQPAGQPRFWPAPAPPRPPPPGLPPCPPPPWPPPEAPAL